MFFKFCLLANLLILAACSDSNNSSGNSVTDPNPNLPNDVALSALQVPASVVAGDSFQISFTVSNHGSVLASPGVIVFLSFSPVPSLNDPQLSLSLPSLTFDPGQDIPVTLTLVLPANLGTGTYYIGLIAPLANDTSDATPANNNAAAAIQVTGTACVPDSFEDDDDRNSAVDLAVAVPETRNFCEDLFDWIAVNAVQGTTYSFHFQGEEFDLNSSYTLYIADPDPDVDLVRVDRNLNGYYRYHQWTAPLTGRVLVRISPSYGLSGIGEGSDYVLTLSDGRPDVSLSDLRVWPDSSHPGDVNTYSLNLRIDGTVGSGGLTISVYASLDSTITVSDNLIGSYTHPTDLSDTSLYLSNLQFTFPGALSSGLYYIGAIADPANTLSEWDETNNGDTSIALNVFPLNCTPDAYEEDDNFNFAGPLSLGEVQSRDFCDDGRDWFSFAAVAGSQYGIRATPVFGTEIHLEVYERWSPESFSLTPIAEAVDNLAFTAGSTGTYRVMAFPENYRTGFESFYTDSVYTLELLNPVPDLIPGIQSTSGSFTPGGFYTVNFSTTNRGGAAADSVLILVVLSLDSLLSADDDTLSSPMTSRLDWRSGSNSIAYQGSGALPSTLPPGPYYLGVISDPGNLVTESDESNNTVWMAL